MQPETDTCAFWVTAAGSGELRREALRAPTQDEAMVQTLYSGVSRGTESLVFGGHVPPSEHRRMRAPFQGGDFPAPVKYGYASVGRVVQGPSNLEGRTVFCLYPHQQRYVVPVEALHVLPDTVPAGRAVLAANVETALNGIWDAAVLPGDHVTVVGGGSVGCLVAWLAARIPGCEVELVDINPRRERIAAGLGTSFAVPEAARTDRDVVIHASGSSEGLGLALRLAAFEARVIELSWYGDRTVALSLGEAFHSRRLTLKSSQVGAVAQAQRPRWSFTRRLGLALSLLADPVLDALINSEGLFEELPETMQALARAPGDTIMHRVRYLKSTAE